MQFSADENFAKQLDAEDPMRSFRDKFHLPLGKDGKPLIYFAGNSLGLMPKAAREAVDQELDDWGKLGVDAHLGARTPWYTYHEPLREPTARDVGAKAAQKHGIIVGFDLAHAAGNVPLAMHEWNVDFAVWCTYKYLNAGPGAIGGAYLHERHATNTKLPRFAGWFGNDPNTRFQMQLEPEFIPVSSADAWQVSNPPIFSMAPLRASLSIFDEAGGMKSVREKSLKLTGYLEFLLNAIGSKKFTIITPEEASARGCQLSILAHEHPKELFKELQAAGVKCDFREPDVIRVAPTPLYNTFENVWRFSRILAQHK